VLWGECHLLPKVLLLLSPTVQKGSNVPSYH
jgi:hypothetical protein